MNGYFEPENIDIIKYDITMINSDFKLNFNVDRDKLYDLIRNDIKMRCVFDDSIYPGVKIYYYWNFVIKIIYYIFKFNIIMTYFICI